MKLVQSLVALAITSLASVASAQITPIGPFTGNAGTEGFETQVSASGQTCLISRVFTGQADLCSNAMLLTSGWSFGCQIGPHSGARFAGSASGVAVYTFDTAVTRFGGYLGNNSSSGVDGVASFYDQAGVLMGTMPYILPNNCTWLWSGWDFGTTPVKRVELSLNNYGGFTMMDSMEADIVGATTGSIMCVGDGTGIACPCGNLGGTDQGCANSMTTGANMIATGFASVGNDSLQLYVSNCIPNTSGVFFSGPIALGGGTGALFGDGLRCAGGPLTRLEVRATSGTGDVSSTLLIHNRDGSNPGDTRYYQYWYQDAGGIPCGTGFNTSAAVKINWVM